MRLQSDIAGLLARALVVVDELAVQRDPDSRPVCLNEIVIPGADLNLRRCRRCLQVVNGASDLERMTFRVGDGIESSLVDLNFVALGISLLERIRYVRCRDADIYPRIFFSPADSPIQRKDEGSEVLLKMPGESSPPEGLQDRTIMTHRRAAVGPLDQLPLCRCPRESHGARPWTD